MQTPYIEQEQKIMTALKAKQLNPERNPNCFWNTIFHYNPYWYEVCQYTREQIREINTIFEIVWLEQGARPAALKGLNMLRQIHKESGEVMHVKRRVVV